MVSKIFKWEGRDDVAVKPLCDGCHPKCENCVTVWTIARSVTQFTVALAWVC